MSEPTRNEMILGLFDRPIAFHRPLVTITGSVTAALLLSQAIYWQRRTTSEDGWFWKTQKEWEEETGLGRREFDSARKACAAFLKSELRGVPARLHFKVDEEAIFAACQTSLAESAKLACTKTPNRLGGKCQTTNTETTSETTSKNPSQPDGAKSSEGEGKGDGKPDVDKSAKETHREFIELWTESFEMQFGRKYVFQGGKDGQALKRLIAAAKMSAGELMRVATLAWVQKGKLFWNCEKAVTICDFCSRFNQIVAELSRFSKTIPQIQKPPGVEDDHEARYGFKRGAIPLSQRPPPGEDEAGNKISREEWEERFPLSLYDHDK